MRSSASLSSEERTHGEDRTDTSLSATQGAELSALSPWESYFKKHLWEKQAEGKNRSAQLLQNGGTDFLSLGGRRCQKCKAPDIPLAVCICTGWKLNTCRRDSAALLHNSCSSVDTALAAWEKQSSLCTLCKQSTENKHGANSPRGNTVLMLNLIPTPRQFVLLGQKLLMPECRTPHL